MIPVSYTHLAGKAEDNAIEWYGPLYLQMRYGK